MFDCNRLEAQKLITQKQGLEISLVWDVYEVFSTDFLPTLRQVCRKSILEVDNRLGANRSFLADFPKKWSFYACMRGLKNWRPYNYGLLSFARTWSAFECGDWIRVYGEIVEEGYLGKDVNAQRIAPQKDTTNIGTWKKHQIKGRGQDLKTNQGSQNSQKGRRRAAPFALDHDELIGYSEIFGGNWVLKTFSSREGNDVKKKTGVMKITPARDVATSGETSGIMNWVILDNDLTGKMDQVFGLMRGATISGTTTDNIFILQRFSHVIDDKIFFLLPLGTIGAGGHHSLIEIATPLTLNNYIDYSVGCYGTLFPKNYQSNPATRGGAEAIKRILQAYDRRGMANLILCYYNAKKLEGCYVAEQSEWHKWLYAFKADQSLLQRFTNVPPYPSKEYIKQFAIDSGLTIR
ncbi:hypothetical protein [Desulfosarcina ovata]|uniref:Uncharacterized protein n=1 Tax=Desulfosarcina ovata subsp. ovata TaxID=2752305 RepID=A0A5K8A8A6_9BACT|nr:hypothetical protein [Desulfosarcina ovata]BBO88765.1 hypothetical protein DSCOOX_19450 [Desulfosarcina ovata subsp. ovata]